MLSKQQIREKIDCAIKASRAERENLFFVLNPRNGELIEKTFSDCHILGQKNLSLWDITGAANKRQFQLELVNQWNRQSARHNMGFIYFLP